MPSVPEYELNADMIQDKTQQTIQATFEIEAQGYCCNGEMLVDVLLKVVSENSSVEATCAELSDVADSNRIREHLNEQFDMAKYGNEQRTSIRHSLVKYLRRCHAGDSNCHRLSCLLITRHSTPVFERNY